MTSQAQITFRNMMPVREAEDWILEEIAKLETLYGRLMRCRVTVEVPHRHHKEGSPYHVRILLTLPQGEVVVKREPSLSGESRHLGRARMRKSGETRVIHRDLRQAINDAFKAAGRRLQDYARRQRGDTKSRSTLPEGQVSRIDARKGYGFLTSSDGREIYFHKNSVLGRAFPRLKVGMTVRFVEETGESGPQASTVHLVGKRVGKAAEAVAAS